MPSEAQNLKLSTYVPTYLPSYLGRYGEVIQNCERKKRKNKRVLNEKMSVYLDSRLREMREKERERE